MLYKDLQENHYFINLSNLAQVGNTKNYYIIESINLLIIKL